MCLNIKICHFKLCFLTAIHDFMWMKIADIYLMWNQIFANFIV